MAMPKVIINPDKIRIKTIAEIPISMPVLYLI